MGPVWAVKIPRHAGGRADLVLIKTRDPGQPFGGQLELSDLNGVRAPILRSLIVQRAASGRPRIRINRWANPMEIIRRSRGTRRAEGMGLTSALPRHELMDSPTDGDVRWAGWVGQEPSQGGYSQA